MVPPGGNLLVNPVYGPTRNRTAAARAQCSGTIRPHPRPVNGTGTCHRCPIYGIATRPVDETGIRPV